MSYKPKVANVKKDVVKDFAKLLTEYPIIAAVNMEGLPTPQLQNMRAQLRDKVELRMTKRRLMKIALEKAKDKVAGIEQLEPYLKGMPALLFTKENPFSLYKTLDKNKSSAPAKAGQEAPKDVIVPAGGTPFAPGPVIGELGALGIKSGVEGGKIVIKEDKVLLKAGDVFTAGQASILSRLGIEPMEIGLNITAVYENGTIYTPNILAIDEQEYLDKLTQGHQWAFNLAVEAGYYTKDTVEVIIPKAFTQAKAVAMEANILADVVAEELLTKAERQMLALKNTANIADAPAAPVEKKEEEPKEEKKEEPKPEEPKEEPKAEEKPVEEKKEEPVKEEVKEEAKPEEQPTEEPAKEEEKAPEPAEEPKAEEPKEEPAPQPEAPKEEPKEEEKAPEPTPEPEAPTPEAPKEEPKEEKPVEESKPKEEEKPAAPVQEAQPMEKPIQEAPKPDEPLQETSVESLIAQTKAAFNKGKKVEQDKGPSASDLLDEVQEPKKKEPEKVPSAYDLMKQKQRHTNQ